MKNERYLDALLKVIPADTKDWTGVHFLLEDTCRTIDTLQANLVADSRDMARRFTGFAEAVENQEMFSPPTGYSSLQDITTNYAKLVTRIDVLRSLLRAELGKNTKAFWDEVNKS